VRNLLAVALFASLSSPLTFAQSAIVRVFADQKNHVHVLYKDGQDIAVAGEPGQVGIDTMKISQDGQTAGWLALDRDPDSSETFAGILVLLRAGKIVQKFHTEQTFWSWSFYEDGTQVAYHVGPTHGDARHYELHDIKSGRLVASWDGDLNDAKHPEWTKGLAH
jgi:hypothetical protein